MNLDSCQVPITVENCCELSRHHGIERLSSRCQSFLTKNFDEVVAGDHFGRIDALTLRGVLAEPALSGEPEKAFSHLCAWFTCQVQEMQVRGRLLLEYIEYIILEYWYSVCVYSTVQ